MIINDHTKRQEITILSSVQLDEITNFLIKDFIPKLCVNKWIAPRDIYGGKFSDWSNTPLDILYRQCFNKYNDSGKAHKEAAKQLGIIVINLLRDFSEEFEVGMGFRTKLYKLIQISPDKLSSAADDDEQKTIAATLSQSTREDLKKQLNSNTETNSNVVIEFHGKKYKRNNLDIAIIKHLRGYQCQLCGVAIQKKDGSSYVEAAHIKPKCEQGSETPNNILILCPNHHKEFDLGKREVIRLADNSIVFKLNGGPEYNISLEIV